MRRILATAILALAAAAAFPESERLLLATTTSTENSGLLSVLLPVFEKLADCRVDVVAVGTGAAFKLGENGDADVLLVHDRPAELEFVKQGFGVDRADVMYNDFILLGPAGDPAKVRSASSAVEAFRRIAASRATFISRGDDSGTHRKEREIWREAGLEAAGSWYREVGQGMGAVLTMSNEQGAYTLADRGTWLSMKSRLSLELLYAGDPVMFNPYGIIAVSPTRYPSAKYALAKRLIDWIVSDEARRLITEFKVGGEQLFFTYPRS